MTNEPKQLASEQDRATLRAYLTNRLKKLKRERKAAGEREEAAYVDGAEMEIEFLFDELLGEEPPDLRKKAVGH